MLRRGLRVCRRGLRLLNFWKYLVAPLNPLHRRLFRIRICYLAPLYSVKEHLGALAVNKDNFCRGASYAYHFMAARCADRCHRSTVPFTRDLATTLTIEVSF